jgi:hypothetical protein
MNNNKLGQVGPLKEALVQDLVDLEHKVSGQDLADLKEAMQVANKVLSEIFLKSLKSSLVEGLEGLVALVEEVPELNSNHKQKEKI